MLTRRLLGALAMTVLVLALPSSAQASSITQIPSYTDPRGAMPSHPGTLWKALYGPFTIPAATSPSQPGQLHNATTTEPAPPCAPACRITDMMPELIFTDGTTANMQQGILLHHFVFFNPANQALACTNPMSEPFWGSGNERTPLHLPSPYGYENTSANWSMLTHLVNLNTQAKNVYVQVVYRTRPLSETQPTRPVWLDIDNFCNGGNSEYTIQPGYSDTHVDWTSTVDARVINTWGHLHDVDIMDPTPCQTHCAADGGGIALSAEVRDGPAGDYFGPIPPNNPPPSDITGATLCRSEANYGTAYGLSHGGAGHLDTMSQCGIFSEVPAGAQAEMFPPSAGYSFEGYPIRPGQVIRLHSEYQNGTSHPEDGRDGDHEPLARVPEPVPAAEGRDAVPRVAGAGLQGSALRPTAPTARRSPIASCSPPVQESGYLTVGSPDANGTAVNMAGSVTAIALVGNAATTADEADVRFVDVDHRRAPQERPRRLHRPAPAEPEPADHRPLQRSRGDGHRAGRRELLGHGPVRGDHQRHDRQHLLGHDDRGRDRAPAPCSRTGARSGSSARSACTTAAPDGVASTPATRCSPCRACSYRQLPDRPASRAPTLEAPPARVWETVQKVDTLRYITRGLLGFRPLAPGAGTGSAQGT